MIAKYGGKSKEDIYIRFTDQDLGSKGGLTLKNANRNFENGSYFWESPKFKRKYLDSDKWSNEFEGKSIHNEDAVSHFILISNAVAEIYKEETVEIILHEIVSHILIATECKCSAKDQHDILAEVHLVKIHQEA